MQQQETQFDLNLIAVFDALLRERNVTRAAEDLDMSQSAMSHALKRLRVFFNDPLFVKTGSGMQPTPRALELSSTVLGLMGTIRADLLVHAGFEAHASRRQFSLCMTDMGELIFLPRLVERLRQVAPFCTVRVLQISPRQIAAALESGEADLALGSLHSMPEGLFQQQLFTRSFVTLVNKGRKDIGDTMTVEQFFAMEHIVVSLSGKKEDGYDSVVDEYGTKRRIYLTTPHFLTVPLMIERNPDLIATVPRELASAFARYKAVRMVETPISLPHFAIRQHWHPRFHHDAANSWLRKLVKEVFEGLPE
ncbi:LysR family transcriptional regulator [Massilia cavernae]|uniref:LysR family transcriptional regulator n=1 Tax=Massilia cavernae TaxID=2320864 RepID=A0A418Y6D4_9BURK|nr:LysR family transcriptional regulator [Massilia cavernae]RJG23445.1 LysR family transcriptional regulator [Massilia cavernae]